MAESKPISALRRPDKKIGALGEWIAAAYLKKHEHTTIAPTLRRRYAEIDLTTMKMTTE